MKEAKSLGNTQTLCEPQIYTNLVLKLQRNICTSISNCRDFLFKKKKSSISLSINEIKVRDITVCFVL